MHNTVFNPVLEITFVAMELLSVVPMHINHIFLIADSAVACMFKQLCQNGRIDITAAYN